MGRLLQALLFTYEEALDVECLVAAAARLADLLAAARRTGRGLAMTLRERGDLGDLMEGLGQLVLGRLDGASAAQAARCGRETRERGCGSAGRRVGLTLSCRCTRPAGRRQASW